MAEGEFPNWNPFKADIGHMLTEDKKAKRNKAYGPADYDRLVTNTRENFHLSYRTVAGYVAKEKRFSARDRVSPAGTHSGGSTGGFW